MDARKERMDADAAWNLLRHANKIITAKGKKFQNWNPKTDDPAAILQQVMGPSGNLRAPTLKIQDTFLVGFHPEVFQEWVRN